MSELANLLPLSEACARTGLSPKRLLGLAVRNDAHDPLVVDLDACGQPLLVDDWRLENCRLGGRES